jgi:hypothetical protein
MEAERGACRWPYLLGMAFRRRTLQLVALLPLVLVSGCSGKTSSKPPTLEGSPPVILEVTGHITEIEDGNLSLRAIDQRQFIFSIANPPVSIEYLEDHFHRLAPIHITYRAEEGRLIPIVIEDPGSDGVQATPTPTG